MKFNTKYGITPLLLSLVLIRVSVLFSFLAIYIVYRIAKVATDSERKKIVLLVLLGNVIALINPMPLLALAASQIIAHDSKYSHIYLVYIIFLMITFVASFVYLMLFMENALACLLVLLIGYIISTILTFIISIIIYN